MALPERLESPPLGHDYILGSEKFRHPENGRISSSRPFTNPSSLLLCSPPILLDIPFRGADRSPSQRVCFYLSSIGSERSLPNPAIISAVLAHTHPRFDLHSPAYPYSGDSKPGRTTLVTLIVLSRHVRLVGAIVGWTGAGIQNEPCVMGICGLVHSSEVLSFSI